MMEPERVVPAPNADDSYDIVPAELAVEAMRDNGYKSTAHAIAELIDNSVQAKATLVEVFCTEEAELVTQRQRHRVTKVAVLDNGEGMSEQELRKALQFGNGSHLKDRSGIGRFGMGLPSASISQCRRVEVWSWQAGPDNASYTYLDVTEISSRQMREVPEPSSVPVPELWRTLARDAIGEHGTLVVWSDLDRLDWKGAQAMLANTEFLIGRIYRKIIQGQGVTIRLAAIRDDQASWEHDVRPNDPLYLMAPTLTPAPFDTKPMFQSWGETGEETIEVKLDGETHNVVLRYTYALDEARIVDGGDAGGRPYGKYAARNAGVSLVRADRELDLVAAWADDYRDRWWGIEVAFPPVLDEVFGVTNNKQAATRFNELAELHLTQAEEQWVEQKDEWKDEEDPRFLLVDIVESVVKQRNLIRQRLQAQTAGRRGAKRHDARGVEDRATAKVNDRIAEGHDAGQVDGPVTDETAKAIEEDLEKKGYAAADAKEIAAAIVKHARKVNFSQAHSDTSAFFWPEEFPGVTQISLNTAHPAFQQLFDVLSSTEEDDPAVLRALIDRASDTLMMMLAAWARFELETRPESQERRSTGTARKKWGEFAADFLSDGDGSGA